MKAQYIHATGDSLESEYNPETGVSLNGETYKILPLSDIIDIDQLKFHGFTKSEIDNVIEFNNRLHTDDLEIRDLKHEVRRLREELKEEKSNFKSFREQAILLTEQTYGIDIIDID